MAVAFLDIFAAVANGLGVASFGLTNFPGNKPSSAKAVIQISAGFAQNCSFPATGKCNSTSKGNLDPNGDLSVIEVYNEEGKNVGHTSEFDFNAGQSLVATVDTKGQDASYLRLVAGNNGVCISYVAVTYPSGAQHAFVGDLWRICAPIVDPNDHINEWYYGNVEAGNIGNDNSVWYPICGWIDQDQTCGHQITSMMSNVAFMGYNNSIGPKDLCNPPYLYWSASTALTWINNPEDPTFPNNKKKRNTCSKKKKRAQYTTLVRSDIPSHNATQLCKSNNSRGPDFISLHEGVHCDMETRKVTPLCTGDSPSHQECFHYDEENQSGNSRSGEKSTTLKQYSALQHWEHDFLHANVLAKREAEAKAAQSSWSWMKGLTESIFVWN